MALRSAKARFCSSQRATRHSSPQNFCGLPFPRMISNSVEQTAHRTLKPKGNRACKLFVLAIIMLDRVL